MSVSHVCAFLSHALQSFVDFLLILLAFFSPVSHFYYCFHQCLYLFLYYIRLEFSSVFVFIFALHPVGSTSQGCLYSFLILFPEFRHFVLHLFVFSRCFYLCFELLLIEPIPLLSFILFLIMGDAWCAIQSSRRSPGDTGCACSRVILDLLLPSHTRSPLNCLLCPVL